MILIFSKETDYSTDEVIKWLNFHKASWVRINGEDIDEKSKKLSFFFGENTSKKNGYFFLSGKKIYFNSIKAAWFRRSHSFSKVSSLLSNQKLEVKAIYNLTKFLKGEVTSILRFIIKNLNCKWLDHPNDVSLNKLSTLSLANEIGIKIPETLVTNDLSELKRFASNAQIITKAINEVESFEIDKHLYMLYTRVINKEKLNQINDEFCFPILIQKKIQKKYEIRSFYLEGDFYSMAIFSQNDNQTKIDFREYNNLKPNRTVPYKLPEELKTKLKTLMITLNLKHGSIDLILGENKEYYFLEVNPVGQFGMTSHPCNYYLEKKIAEMLLKLSSHE